MRNTATLPFFFVLFLGYFINPSLSTYDGPLYDSSAYTECKQHPEEALYSGGILGGWVRIENADSALLTASLMSEKGEPDCVGTVVSKQGCWSFIKGGFVLTSPSNLSLLYFQNSGTAEINIEIASASLQPFTQQQWSLNQQTKINMERKRAVTIHVSDKQGVRLQDASVTIEQISRDFPFGSAIAKYIIGNLPYQDWFSKRFNVAVFENELKWYTTEPDPGKLNYTLADQMLNFVRENQIMGPELKSAVQSRIQSLMSRYRGEFIHWDVSNEMLHFDLYEQKLGPDATLEFFKTAHEADPLATLFMNDFNVVETCSDPKSTVDTYISKMKELKQGGISMDGIGLEGHFSAPNPPLIRAILDKLATLGLPIWLTEIDINKKYGQETQAIYLETVLREGFSHPAVSGIMLWTAISPKGCFQMCLTDNNLNNLPAGDVVDNLLKEWQTQTLEGGTDEHGSYSFMGFLGEYKVSVEYGNRTATSTFSLNRGDETRHFRIQV
nr:anti-sigma-I factor RsgI6 [Ipomoea batatas]